jgi:hypothetical protein
MLRLKVRSLQHTKEHSYGARHLAPILATKIGCDLSGAGLTTESCMYSRVLFIASLILAFSSSASEARYYRTSTAAAECNVTMPCDLSGMSQQPRARLVFRKGVQSTRGESRAIIQNAMAYASGGNDQIVGGRPTGCPRSFCGCGASIRVFGRIVPGLNLASNWLRFPRAAPAPGMVAARRGHVFVLEQHLDGDTWMAYDANSGGQASRIHARSLRGYTVVNPHA